MSHKINKIKMGVLAIFVAAGGFLTIPSLVANAATITLNPGDSIQTAIDGATDGDTIRLNAGTYTETLVITKPLTLEGVGSVTINTQSVTVDKGVDIQNTQNVTLRNLTLDGENNTPMSQSGIDINSVNTVLLDNVTTQNYAKDGIAVTAQEDPSYVLGGNITFTNVTTSGNAWAGIAFYTESSLGHSADLANVVFNGVTTVNNNGGSGIQFGDVGDTAKITGPSGGAVNLGTVHFNGNPSAVTNPTGNSAITIASNSTVDGHAVTAADFPGVNVSILAADTPVVPGVPNTATASL